ncbi:uncharacterized protein CMU_023310 [Cryptosporidium muris RN66]|uniref:ER lumen protein retaining receptor n=1 Tax=Cryptosporidium muris (strain RN66) TaxID=441375 RepID=B6ABX3_CRYMR|nr:uncharacterized protein CMU_023310 [Cryptosporidium muris RN66]EEA05326.1 hypothetical protein, conserved [Cryptosporidium muris RN66]|eukprot:XP_002139675.1 hypothetical protein [Cryptosporidium muris RN66]
MSNSPALYKFSYIHDIFNYATAVSWLLGYCSLFLKLHRDQNAAGLSLQTLFMLVLTELNHVLILIVMTAYFKVPLGIDFYICDCSTVLISLATFSYIIFSFYDSYEEEKDTFGLNVASCIFESIIGKTNKNDVLERKIHTLAKRFHWIVAYLISLLASIPLFLFRRSHLPMLLSFWECYIDMQLTFALVPQLYMFYNKKPRKVSSLLAHFVVFILLARILMLLYWATYPLFKYTSIPGRKLHITTEFLNIIILAHFMFYFIRAKLLGQRDIPLPI